MDVTAADPEAFARMHLLPLGLKLLVALTIFIVGRQISKIALRALDRTMDRSRMDVSLRKFLGDVVYGVLLVAVIPGKYMDLGHVKSLLEAIALADPRIQQTPPPTIDLAEINETHMKLHVRPWTSVENYTKVASDAMERVKSTLETEKLKYSVSLQVTS